MSSFVLPTLLNTEVFILKLNETEELEPENVWQITLINDFKRLVDSGFPLSSNYCFLTRKICRPIIFKSLIISGENITTMS